LGTKLLDGFHGGEHCSFEADGLIALLVTDHGITISEIDVVARRLRKTLHRWGGRSNWDVNLDRASSRC
jgi:hypothetical protein